LKILQAFMGLLGKGMAGQIMQAFRILTIIFINYLVHQITHAIILTESSSLKMEHKNGLGHDTFFCFQIG
jgi:hypothetical protein